MKDAGPTRFAALGILVLTGTGVLLAATASPPEASRKLFGLWSARYALLGLAGFLVAAILLLRAFSRDAGMSAAVTVAVVGVVWGGAEALGRLGVVDYGAMFQPRSTEPALGTVPLPNADVSGSTFMDTATGWGLRSEPIDFHYVTNALGFRNRPDRTEADIYLIGDSILVSALTPFEETVTARVEALTGKPTLTVALIGISPALEQRLFREAKLPVAGRLVLQFIFEGNDLKDTKMERDIAKGAPPPRSPDQTQSLTKLVVLLLQRLTQPVVAEADRLSCTIDDQRYTFYWTRDAFAGVEAQMEHIEAGLLAFSEEIEAAGGRYGVVFVPTKLRVLAEACTFPEDTWLAPLADHLSPMPEHLRAFAKAHDIPFLDLTEPLRRAASTRPVPWFWGDTHPNARGHEVMAQAIARWSFVSSSTVTASDGPRVP